MRDTTEQVLVQAYDLIEQNKIDEARSLLEPLITSEQDNPDVWWLYAHAVADIDSAEKALDNVIRLDRNYLGALNLKQQLIEIAKRGGALESSLSMTEGSAIPQTLPEDVPEQWNRGVTDKGEHPRTGRSRIIIYGALIIVVGIISAVVILTLSSDDSADDGAAPTSVTIASAPPTDFQPQLAPTDNSIDNAIQLALQSVGVHAEEIDQISTEIGETLVVSVCTQAGLQLRDDLQNVLDSLATELDLTLVNADALGASMVDCDNNNTLLDIAMTVENAAEFAQGNLDTENFQATWVAIDF